jgi:hypothetical protein
VDKSTFHRDLDYVIRESDGYRHRFTVRVDQGHEVKILEHSPSLIEKALIILHSLGILFPPEAWERVDVKKVVASQGTVAHVEFVVAQEQPPAFDVPDPVGAFES